MLYRHRHAFDREFAIRSASSTVLHYQNAYDAISRSLGLNTDRTTVRSLAIQHGCDALEEPTEYLINSFYEKYTMTLTSNQKSFISKKDPALIVAAFVLCAQAYKTRTDKKALLDRNKIKLKHYTTFTSLIKQYCVDEINDLKSGINLQKRKVNHNEHFDIRYNENTENNIDKDISVNHIASIMYFDFVKSCILGDLKLDSNWFEYNSWRKEIYRTIDSTKK